MADTQIQRMARSEHVTAQVSVLETQRDTLALIGPRILRDHAVKIGPKVYITVAGATLMATVFGFHVREISSKRIEVDGVGGWETFTEIIRSTDEMIVGRGSAICMDDEKMWSGRPQFARRAMSSTRAAGRALRLFFGHAFSMLGDQVASVTREEMPDE